MQNELLFIFKAEDMKRLVAEGTDLIVVRSFLKSVILKDGSKAGALKVFADAVNKGKPKILATIEGCPHPPCDIEGGTIPAPDKK